MQLDKYIGFKFEDLKPILEEKSINYEIIEVFDLKNTKIGNDVRIINIKKENDKIKIYVAYF